MKCPECEQLLEPMTVSAHLTIPECASCGGVWIPLEDWSLLSLCLDARLDGLDRWESAFEGAINGRRGEPSAVAVAPVR